MRKPYMPHHFGSPKLPHLLFELIKEEKRANNDKGTVSH
jgi:hypothetical protein